MGVLSIVLFFFIQLKESLDCSSVKIFWLLSKMVLTFFCHDEALKQKDKLDPTDINRNHSLLNICEEM